VVELFQLLDEQHPAHDLGRSPSSAGRGEGSESREKTVESIEKDASGSSTSVATQSENRSSSDVTTMTSTTTVDSLKQNSAQVEVVIPTTTAVNKAERPPMTPSMVTNPIQLEPGLADIKKEDSWAARRALRDSAGRFLPISPRNSVSGKSQGKSARAVSAASSPSRIKAKLPQNKLVGGNRSERKAKGSTNQRSDRPTGANVRTRSLGASCRPHFS
jgi:hypothetical protein